MCTSYKSDSLFFDSDKVRGSETQHGLSLCSVGPSLCSQVAVCPCSLSLLICLSFGTACPADFKLQHQMQRQQRPYGDCLISRNWVRPHAWDEFFNIYIYTSQWACFFDWTPTDTPTREVLFLRDACLGVLSWIPPEKNPDISTWGASSLSGS